MDLLLHMFNDVGDEGHIVDRVLPTDNPVKTPKYARRIY